MIVINVYELNKVNNGSYADAVYSTDHFDGLVQEKRKSIANALELCLSCTNLSISQSIHMWCETTYKSNTKIQLPYMYYYSNILVNMSKCTGPVG